MSVTSYRTIARDAEAAVEVKRSRFLATIVRVEDEAGARQVIDDVRQRHWDARHHCSAFVIGPDGRLQRSNDDGEPAGTAGAPMLETLRGRDVSDVVAVVTRWFGGTLLGAGGLVRAYSDAVAAGLDAAGGRRRELLSEFDLSLDHADAGRVESELRGRGVHVIDARYGARVSLTLGVRAVEADRFDALVAEVTAGSAVARPAGQRWVDA